MVPSGRKFWGYMTLAGASLAILIGTSILRRGAAVHPPTLPAAIRESVKREALEWRSAASLVGFAAAAQLRWLGSEAAIEDEARLIEVCDNLAAASVSLVQDFHRRASTASGEGKEIGQIEVERFLRQTLRDLLPPGPEGGAEQDDAIFQLPVAPLHTFILSAPALAPPAPMLQRILERLLQVLTRLLQHLPPGSPAAAAIQRAIDAILELLGTTDTMAPVIQGLSPTPGSLTNDSTPTISGSIVDAGGSGVDLGSLVVRLDGIPVAATTTVVNADHVDFSFTPDAALGEGPHDVSVDVIDLTGNSAATATTSFVIDSLAPVIVSPQPADGSAVATTTPTISVAWSDPSPGSGINPASASVKIDEVLVAATVTNSGFSLMSPPLPEGAHVVSATIRDHAGNSASLEWTFLVQAPPTGVPPAPTNVAATPGPSGITITWEESAGAGSYSVKRAASPGGPFGTIAAGVAGLSHLDSGLLSGTSYFYVVSAHNGSGESEDSSPPASARFDGGPLVDLLDPGPDTTISVTETDLVVRISDEDGFVPSQVSVSLNGQVVGLLPQTSTEELVATLLASVSAQAGGNLLTVDAKDLLNNRRVVSFTFTVASSPGSTVQISKQSGDSQTGTTSFLSAPLTVRVFDAASGQNLQGIPVNFTIASGEGRLVLPESADRAEFDKFGGLRTAADGTASVGFVFGDGSATVEAAVVGDSGLKVQFSITGRLPTLQELNIWSPCNSNPSPFEFEGSALPRIFQLKLSDHNGNPLQKQMIKPEVLAPRQNVGYFMPSQGITGSDGIAKFAFVINDGADPGNFTMRWSAPLFEDLLGEPVRVDMVGGVNSGGRDPYINREDPASTGQGQIAEPNQILPNPFKAKTDDLDRRTIIFEVLEGNGSFVDVVEGSLWHADVNSCGKPYFEVRTTDDGRAAVRFRKGADNDPVLVVVYGPTDVFAVGASEALFVEESSPGSGSFQGIDEIRSGVYRDREAGTFSAIQGNQFYVEVRKPLGGPASVTHTIKTLSTGGTDASAAPAFLGPVSVSLSLQKVEDYLGRYSRYRSPALLAITETAEFQETVSPMTQLPSGEKVVQLLERRGLVLQGLALEYPQQAAPVLPSVAVTCVGGVGESKLLPGGEPALTERLLVPGKPAPGDVTVTKGKASSEEAKAKLEFGAATAEGYIPFKVAGADAYRGNPDGNADPLVEGGWVDVEVKVKGKTVGAARIVIAPQLWVRMLYGEFGAGRGSPETRYEELSARSAVLRNRIKSTTFFPNKTIAALVTKKEFEGAFSQKGLFARTRGGVVAGAVGRTSFFGGNFENKVRQPELYDTGVFLAGMYFTDVMKEEFEGSLGFISPRGQNLKYPNDQVSVLIRATQNAQKSTNQTFDQLHALSQPPTPGGVKWYTIENFSFVEQVVLFPNVVVERLCLIRPRAGGDDKTVVDRWTQIFEDNEANFPADEVKKYEFAPK